MNTPLNTITQTLTGEGAKASSSVITATFIRDAGTNEATGLRLDWSEGDAMILMAEDLPTAIQYEAMIHGLKQKLVDGAALPRNTTTGKPATVAEKRAAVQEILDRLIEGQWNKTREGGSGKKGEMRLLARAVAAITEQALAEVETWLAARTDDEKTALLADKGVRAKMEQFRAEGLRADASIDTGALLASLGQRTGG